MSETKKKRRSAKRKEWNSWLARAKEVGVDPLPPRRPTPAQKKEWREEIVRREDEIKAKEEQ